MDTIRRGAMLQMGRALIGTTAAVASIGRGNASLGSASGLAAQQKMSADYPAMQASSGYNESKIDDRQWREEKLGHEARHRAAQPLQQKLDEIYQRTDRITMARVRGLGEAQHDLAALKSVSPWWKDTVAMDRGKKLQSAAQTIQAEIDKILNGPLEALSETFQTAIKSFLAEANRP